ncbi:MAG: hypothetical protein GY835_09155, partial [bacterium]|nr:hypothetical protein [bacterium]
DDFDDIHPWAAVSLANHLRVLFEEHKEHFSFVLTAESDLHELRDTDHVYSPLPNVSISYHLLDLDEDQLRRYALKRSEGWDRHLSEDDLDSLWQQTQGYPALVDAILGSLQRGRLAGSDYSVADAVKSCMRARREPEPIGTAVRRVEELTNLNVRDCHPARVLHQLTLGTSPTVNDRGARVLLAMGVLGWRSGRHITWRNPLIQTFWEDSEHGQRLIKGWIQRPISTQQGVLRAEGAVLVSL